MVGRDTNNTQIEKRYSNIDQGEQYQGDVQMKAPPTSNLLVVASDAPTRHPIPTVPSFNPPPLPLSTNCPPLPQQCDTAPTPPPVFGPFLPQTSSRTNTSTSTDTSTDTPPNTPPNTSTSTPTSPSPIPNPSRCLPIPY